MVNETYIKKEDGSLELIKSEVINTEPLNDQEVIASLEEQMLALYEEINAIKARQ